MIRLLVLRRFAEHRLRSVLSLAGVAVGAGLAVAVLGFLGSLTGSVDHFVASLSGAADLELVSASEQGMDERLFFRIEQVDGVRSAVPMMSSPAIFDHRGGLLIGIDERARALGTGIGVDQAGRLDAAAARPGLFLGAAFAQELGREPGDSVSVATRGGVRSVEVLGLVAGEGAGFNEGRFAATSIPLAQQLLGEIGRLDSVLVLGDGSTPRPALARRLAAAVGAEAVVESPARRADQARQATRSMRLGMQLGVGVGFIVGGFVVFNVMSMAAEERRRELATVRAVGGRRGPLLALFVLEAAVLGLAGSIAGSVAGLAVSRHLVEDIPPALASQVGVEVGFRLPGYTIPVAVVGSIAVAVVAALVPARRAVGVPPVEAMRPEGLGHVDRAQRVVVGPAVAGVAMGVVFSALAVAGPPPLDLAAVWGLLVAIILATYGFAYPIARAAAACSNPLGATGRLAGSAVQRAPRRAWAAGAAVAAATASVVAQAGIFDNLTEWIASSFGHLDRVALYVSAEDPDRPGTGRRLPGDWREGLGRLPGVAHVGVHSSASVAYEGDRVAVDGVEGSVGAEPAMAGVSPAVRRRVESGQGAVVSTRFSELHSIRPGDRLRLATPSGEQTTEVVGVVPSLLEEGQLLTIGRAPLVAWFGASGANEYLVSVEPGARASDVRRDIDRFLDERGVAAFVTSGSQYAQAAYATLDQVRQLFSAMTWVITGAGVLAIVNALLMSVLERRRELGILRALGTSRRQLAWMVVLEAGAIGLVGGAIGSAVGLLMHRAGMEPILAPLAEQSSLPVEYHLVALPAVLSLLLGVAIAGAGSVIPARRAGRLDVIEAIGYE